MFPASYNSQTRTVWKLLCGGALLTALTFAIPASAQSTSAPKIKQNEIKYVSPDSGKQMYGAYCASCHGVDGKGNATAAAALLQQPTDLTLLSSRNNGRFPAASISYLLKDPDLRHDRAASGMPVWAPAFKSLQKGHNDDLVVLRVHNLVAHLKTMQAPPVSAGADRQ